MDKLPAYEETLITRYLSGEASDKEASELKSWLEADPGHQAIFSEYRESWRLAAAVHIEESVDVDSEWEQFRSMSGIDSSPVVRKLNRRSWSRVSRIAAVFLILILPAAIYFLFFMSPGQDTLYAESQIIESTLPDGTSVTLNMGSLIRYPEKFRGNERKVELEGEAFFDVVRNEKMAFIIEAEAMQIRVLGTSFYVNTRAEDNTMEVVLMSGSVDLSYENQHALLKPGDKAVILTASGEIIKQLNNDPNLLAWKTKVLRFNNTPLGDVVEILQKVYQKDIKILNPDLHDCRITATFEGENFESVLQVIQSTLNITIRPNGSTIEISGEGC